MVWAYICEACQHEASRHLLAEDGDFKAGPYRCKRCACEIRQDSPMFELTERQYRAHMQKLGLPA